MSTETTQEITEIANKLVQLCREGKNMEAINTLYSENIVSAEPMVGPDNTEDQRVQTGIDAIRAKNNWWFNTFDVTSAEVQGPYFHQDRFSVFFKFSVAHKESGEKMDLAEVGVYTVENGKVTREEFFCPPMCG